ncbi:MAG: amino-acid N-acetyltransferase [Pirellulaceae bacterium]|nr:amino-acid N-acetyltransferase [Pirellulaceae bacterium]
MIRLTDFREILRYVPDFRGRVFVIGIDGEVIAHANFPNLLLDIALLHNLNIRVVLVHGAGFQLREAAEQLGRPLSNSDGTGITDAQTLDLSVTVASRVLHQVLTGLAAVDLAAACPNAVVAHPAGILKGIDMEFTGRVERIDVASLLQLLENRFIPVLPPLGFDGQSQTYRLNSDSLAAAVAGALRAVKLIFVTPSDGVVRGGVLQRQLSVGEARELLRAHRDELAAGMVSKVEQACEACGRGVSRVHVISGLMEEGLLAEVFSNEGVGTLVYDDEYEVIRRATSREIPAIVTLVQQAAEQDEVVSIGHREIEAAIQHFFVVEIDHNPVACAALHPYPDEGKAELATVVVGAGHENRGIGRRLIRRIEEEARQSGVRELFCLSTQAFAYFMQKAGFELGSVDDLPAARRIQWARSGRNSRVLKKLLD